jgi:beta-galactosidase
MRFGYKLTDQNDLAKTAILADYDQALCGVAIAEMFDGKGSVILTGLDIVGRVGVDPVADRMLVNLIHYMGGDEGHAKYPLVKGTIKWGDFQSENGVISGPVYGFFRNTKWLVPPTDPNGAPIPQDKSAWNTKPGDQFVPDGIRPRGPYTYSFNCAPKDTDKTAKTGTGIFFATIPSGRRTVVSKVRNPSKDASEIVVEVNGKKGETTKIPAGQTTTIRSSIPNGATDVGVRYTGEKDLVIEETSFQ